MSISGNFSAGSRPAGSASKPPAGSAADVAKKAKQALAKGIQDGGPVTDVKPKSDQSGASGENDYFSALGYDS
jgi:hypothetical protein